MFAARDGARAAGRFVAASVVTAVVLIAALAPRALFAARRGRLVQNSVLFPLGLTRYKTPAESLLPGHLLTALGPAGHVVSVGLLLAAGLGIAVSLVIRPPRDVPAAAWRLAVGLALMFLLGPDVRFGYFIYPLGLIGWLALNSKPPTGRRAGQASTLGDPLAPPARSTPRHHPSQPGTGMNAFKSLGPRARRTARESASMRVVVWSSVWAGPRC